MTSDGERRICWRCVLTALPPLAALAALIWFVGLELQAQRATAVETPPAAAQSSQSDDARLAALTEELTAERRAAADARRAAEAAAAEATQARAVAERAEAALSAMTAEVEKPLSLEALTAAVARLEAPERKLLAERAELPPPSTAAALAAALAAAPEDERAALFAGAPELPGFQAWFESLSSEGRREWLERLPAAASFIAPTPISAPGATPLDRGAQASMAQNFTREDEAVAACVGVVDENAVLTREVASLKTAETALRAEVENLERALRSGAPAPIKAASLARSLDDLAPAEAQSFFERLPALASFQRWFAASEPAARATFVNALPEISGVEIRAASDQPEAPMSMDAARREMTQLRARLDVALRAAGGGAVAGAAEARLATQSVALDALRSEENELRAALLESEAARAEAEAALSAARGHFEESAVSAQQEAAERARAAEARADRATAERDAALAELTNARAEIAAAAAAQQAVDAAEAEAASEALRAEQAVAQFQDLQKRLAEATARAESFRVEAERLSAAQVAMRAELDGRLDETTAALNAARADLSEARATVERLSRRSDRLRRELEEVAPERQPLVGVGEQDFLERLRARFEASNLNPSALGLCQTPSGEPTTLQGFAFSSGQVELTRDGERTLDEIAATLRENLQNYPDGAWRIVVEGHTDKRPVVSGRYPSNWELSALRAAAVARGLARRGIAEERLVVVGRASFEPIDEGEFDAAYEKNRRIEIHIAPAG